MAFIENIRGLRMFRYCLESIICSGFFDNSGLTIAAKNSSRELPDSPSSPWNPHKSAEKGYSG
jgi:hypothetical protein